MMSLSCAPMLVPTTMLSPHVQHKIKIRWMIHHIQTKKHNSVATNYKNSNLENTKQNSTKTCTMEKKL